MFTRWSIGVSYGLKNCEIVIFEANRCWCERMSVTPFYYARVTGISAAPGAIDNVIAVYRDRSPSHVAVTPGLVSRFGLANRLSGRVFGVTVWKSVSDRDRHIVQRVGTDVDLSSYAPYMQGRFSHDAYDVTHYTLPPADPSQPFAPAAARITIEDFLRDGWDVGIAALRAIVMRLSEGTVASGTILFENRGMGRTLLIEVAPTSGELDASAGMLQEHDPAARRSGYLRTRSEHQVYEVMARY